MVHPSGSASQPPAKRRVGTGAGGGDEAKTQWNAPVEIGPSIVSPSAVARDARSQKPDKELGASIKISDRVHHPTKRGRRNRTGPVPALSALTGVVVGWWTGPGNRGLGDLHDDPSRNLGMEECLHPLRIVAN